MSVWEQLLRVQALDTTIQQLDHRDARLPERDELATIDEQLVAVRAEVAVAEAARHDLVKAQRAIEDEVSLIEDRIAHEEAQLYGGGSSDSGLLQALQDEIASLKRRISALEDDEIELMEQVEPIDATLATLAERQQDLDRQAMAATTRLAESESVIGTQRDEANEARALIVADVEASALARYDTVRARLGGIAVARLEPGGVCGACHMKLSAVERDRIEHLGLDDEVECEDCGRYLVRT